MNWLDTYVRPKIRSLVRSKVPDDLWTKCPECGSMLYRKELEAQCQVCSHCGHHLRLPARKRLEMLFDDGEYTRIELPKLPPDPLKFKDSKRYSERLRETQKKTGETDAIQVAHGRMGGSQTVIAAFDFGFMGGSMGQAVGEGIVRAADLAILQDAPLIVVPSSGGARMQEGLLSLMQMPRTTIAVNQVQEKGLPYIVVLSDPTTGGVTASFAMLGDVAIAEPGAVIGFAGARVIQQTIRETLPEGFQRADYLYEHGMVDMVVSRRDLKDTLVRLIDLLRNPRPTADVVPLPSSQAVTPATP